MEGGADVCRAAGIPLAGGHSIDILEPIYGLVALGLVHPKQVKRNADAQPGGVSKKGRLHARVEEIVDLLGGGGAMHGRIGLVLELLQNDRAGNLLL